MASEPDEHADTGVMTPVSACSSGSEAIAHAWRQIVLGDADIAVCGGVEGGIEALRSKLVAENPEAAANVQARLENK